MTGTCGRVYAAVYNARNPSSAGQTALAQRFARAATSSSNSCYDGGDDPSFFSAEQLDGPVTWGVCRPPLRRTVQPGDALVFFAKKSSDSGIDYLFKGFATVERKVSQLDLWRDPSVSVFQQYLNLLIRPKRGSRTKFRHYEPADEHEDWLWRICEPCGHRKEELNRLEASGIFWPDRTSFADGTRVAIGANYVIFSRLQNETVMLAEPVPVAWAPPLRRGEIEKWHLDERSQCIRKLVIHLSSGARSGKRGLKTANPQVAHPHLSLDLVRDVQEWRREMGKVLGV